MHYAQTPLSGGELVTMAQGGESVLIAASDLAAVPARRRIIAETTHTLIADDCGCLLVFTSSTSVTVTVPSGLPLGFGCVALQSGAGQVTFTGSSATVNNRQSQTKTAGQYAVMSLVSYQSNVFVLAGDGA